MTTPSKSKSHKVKNVVLALLTLWSIIAIIILVVWATSPNMKGAAQCRAELQDATERLEGAKVNFQKDKVALEEKVMEAREENNQKNREILLLMERLNTTNATLEESRQENVVLHGNISALQEEVEQLQQKEANLTAHISLQEERMEVLQQNMTEAFHQTEACNSLRKAADSQTMAAQALTKACDSQKQFLQKQLQKYKGVECDAPAQSKQEEKSPPPSGDASVIVPVCGAPALILLMCTTLLLTT
ncbi:uncharacterized protein si:ch211-1a19.3 [Oryzias melastigma]|uniref:Uncharacterized LOC112150957 n=1 Tax=Oryzias melastigma TaxID=30732 RepID=A0A3B3B4R3_ORYME|nr:uncharacterized protein si:ch211-1a19.3 [Oryzias melastigma]